MVLARLCAHSGRFSLTPNFLLHGTRKVREQKAPNSLDKVQTKERNRSEGRERYTFWFVQPKLLVNNEDGRGLQLRPAVAFD